MDCLPGAGQGAAPMDATTPPGLITESVLPVSSRNGVGWGCIPTPRVTVEAKRAKMEAVARSGEKTSEEGV